MAISLKDANRLPLLAVVLVNFVCFYAAIKIGSIFAGTLHEAVGSLTNTNVLLVGTGLIFVGLLNAQLSSETKTRIIFLRWQNPLPGSQAFTRYMNTDSRIDVTNLEKKYGPLPTDPKAQNAIWYKLYKSIEEHPSVMQVHREFLFTRDYSCLSLMMMILLGSAGLFQIPSSRTTIVYFVILIFQFLLASQAARNHGRRFVTTVLALKSADR